MKTKICLIIAALALIDVKFFDGVNVIAITNFIGGIISKVLINAIMGS